MRSRTSFFGALALVVGVGLGAAVVPGRALLGPPTRACEHGQFRSLALVSVPKGVVDCGFPDARGGNVEAVLGDGRGGWFVGGVFAGIGSARAPSLAHLNHDGTIDSAWHAALPPDGNWSTGFPPVAAMTLAGATLYAAGPFGVAGFDAATGSRRWLVRTNGRNGVLAIAAADRTVFIGGDFSRVAGQPKSWLAALAATTGRRLRWTVRLRGPLPMVDALAASGRRLYVGGNGITGIGAVSRPGLAAVDAGTGKLVRWRPSTAPGLVAGAGVGDVETIVVVDGHVFTAGHDGFGITNARTGRNENRRYGALGYRFAGYRDLVYLAGNCRNSFTEIQAQSRNNLASIDLSTGRVTGWAPNVATYTCVAAVAATSDEVLVAGGFSKSLG